MADGVLDLESVAGEARVLPIPPDNASMLAHVQASLEALAIGLLQVTATLEGMTESGAMEIGAD